MSLKSVNLYSLYTSSKLKISDFREYEKILSKRDKVNSIGEREKGSLYYLVEDLIKNGCQVNGLENFYYSYTIPHIGKEFDLLKIGEEVVLNIELKSENVGLDRIKAQLLCNFKYLKYLSKKMYLFTFVSDIKKYYCLNEDLELVECDVKEVLNVINLFSSNDSLEIDELFKANDFLVSPISTPEKFINENYFLTTQQEFIKSKLFSSLEKNTYFKINGEAGTGKTLLLFDIGRTLAKESNCLVVICNELLSSHKIIEENISNFKIINQKQLGDNIEQIKQSNFILIDEAQRLNSNSWKLLNEHFDSLKNKIIFSLDEKQVLTKEEINLNNNAFIDKLNPLKFKLSNRIRINNSIANFSYRLFNLSLKKYELDFSNVNIHFANSIVELKMYLKMYENDFVHIKMSEHEIFLNNGVSISEVLGKDYENVLLVLDNNFFYNNDKLSTHNSVDNDYLMLKLLYQGISRTRERLTLIIYKNKALFTRIINVNKK